MKLVKVGRSSFAKVDDDLYPLIARHKWYLDRGYAKARINGRNVRMHRLVMQARWPLIVDHINRDRLDNRRANLRCCTPRDNSYNRPGRVKTSRYKGVSYYPEIRKYVARRKVNGKDHYGGAFVNEDDAALASDRLALKLHGEFAFTNFSIDRTVEAKDGSSR